MLTKPVRFNALVTLIETRGTREKLHQHLRQLEECKIFEAENYKHNYKHNERASLLFIICFKS